MTSLNQEPNAGEHLDLAGQCRLTDAVERWLRTCAGVTPKTHRLLASHVDQFVELFGERPLASIGPEDVAVWWDEMNDLSESSRRRYRSTLDRFFAWCVVEKLAPATLVGSGSCDHLLEAYYADTPVERSQKRRYEQSRRIRRVAESLDGADLLGATTAQLVNWLDSRPLTLRTRREYIGSLDDFYEWASHKGLLADNPARSIRPHRYLWQPPVVDGRPDPGSDPTLQEAIDLYLWDRHGRGEITARTVRVLADRLKLVTKALGKDLPMSRLDRRAVLDWQRTVGAHAPASRRLYLSALRTFAAWAIAEGFLSSDPTLGIQPVKEPRRAPRALPAESVAKLLAVCVDHRDRVMVTLMVQVGLRCGEVAGLQQCDYDPVKRTLFVKGKGGHERVLPLPQAACDALEGYLDEVGRYGGPLIRAKQRTGYGRDKPLAGAVVGDRVAELMSRAGIKRASRDGVSAHALRHTCASDALDACGNVRTVQEILGHVSLQSTQVYLRRASLDQMRDALEGRTY